ncbi:homeobox protein MSH-D-like [Ornithodoros turicata]|uniref:homeobox protein MSH-D-like n=1 Tax=Ornithodoros turicata TaxID=34597 RepID=UPI0031399140
MSFECNATCNDTHSTNTAATCKEESFCGTKTTDFSIEGLLGKRASVKSGPVRQVSTTNPTEDTEPLVTCRELPSSERDGLKWLRCTRYEPPKLPSKWRRDGPKRRYPDRSPRVPFTPRQVSALEEHFRNTRYLSGAQVRNLAHLLCLTEMRVKIWFQNRRAREKRERRCLGQIEDCATAPQDHLPLLTGHRLMESSSSSTSLQTTSKASDIPYLLRIPIPTHHPQIHSQASNTSLPGTTTSPLPSFPFQHLHSMCARLMNNN